MTIHKDHVVSCTWVCEKSTGSLRSIYPSLGIIWMRTAEQLRHADYCDAFMSKYAFYRWTRQRIHNTLIFVDLYPRLIGYNTIPDSVEPRLESFNLPLVAGVDLPRQSVWDSYNLSSFNVMCHTLLVKMIVTFVFLQVQVKIMTFSQDNISNI